MIRLAMRFPSGRYHATPWDHHVNEGVVEWPPSPWRLLRALTSALHTRSHSADPAVARAALAKLSAPPSFTLPPAATGHTRHYLSQNGLAASDTSMVFDTFVAVDRVADVVVHWPCELTAEEESALAAIAAEVSYLGRAEAWADLRVMGPAESAPAPNCAPSDGRSAPGTVTVRVLCAAEGYGLADLERSTSELQREGWSDPPGTRWTFYRRASDALLPHRAPAVVSLGRPTIAEFALEVGPGSVLPLFVDAVRVGDQLRRAVMSYFRGRPERPSPVFSGRAEGDAPRGDQHRHAHYIADAREHRSRGQRERHRVTHLVVWAEEGFGELEQAALRHVRYLSLPWRREVSEERSPGRRDGDIGVVLSGFGHVDDLAKESPLFHERRRWRSRTPFVLPRHPKGARDTAEEQLRRELEWRGVRAAISRLIEVDDVELGRGGHPTRWRDFRCWRDGDQGGRPVRGYAIEFDQPVRGPLLLGYGSHFGLGQFEAVD